MQLSIRPKKPQHHSACLGHGKWSAKGCHWCETIREREAARRRAGPMASDDLRGER